MALITVLPADRRPDIRGLDRYWRARVTTSAIVENTRAAKTMSFDPAM
jgi:hypothetical protein